MDEFGCAHVEADQNYLKPTTADLGVGSALSIFITKPGESEAVKQFQDGSDDAREWSMMQVRW